MKKQQLALSMPQRLILFICICLVGFMITVFSTFVLGRLLGSNPVGAMRISAIVQDIFTFILPAVITAVWITRLPAKFLCLDRFPKPNAFFIILLLPFISIPAMDAVIYWNANWHLPEAFAAFEAFSRQMEAAAQAAMNMMLGDTSVKALILNILIIGIFAGLSEELIFRGCLQRLLTTGGVNHHAAIWIVAFIFSAIHFQLFGFVPRMLLGAYFGYLLFWTKSLWAPVMAHILNNVLFVITAWIEVRKSGVEALGQQTPPSSVWSILVAVALVAYAIYALHRNYKASLPAAD